MSKPTESKSPNRPLKQSSVGREVTLKATITMAGHGMSTLRVGDQRDEIALPNDVLRAVTGEDDL